MKSEGKAKNKVLFMEYLERLLIIVPVYALFAFLLADRAGGLFGNNRELQAATKMDLLLTYCAWASLMMAGVMLYRQVREGKEYGFVGALPYSRKEQYRNMLLAMGVLSGILSVVQELVLLLVMGDGGGIIVLYSKTPQGINGMFEVLLVILVKAGVGMVLTGMLYRRFSYRIPNFLVSCLVILLSGALLPQIVLWFFEVCTNFFGYGGNNFWYICRNFWFEMTRPISQMEEEGKIFLEAVKENSVRKALGGTGEQKLSGLQILSLDTYPKKLLALCLFLVFLAVVFWFFYRIGVKKFEKISFEKEICTDYPFLERRPDDARAWKLRKLYKWGLFCVLCMLLFSRGIDTATGVSSEVYEPMTYSGYDYASDVYQEEVRVALPPAKYTTTGHHIEIATPALEISCERDLKRDGGFGLFVLFIIIYGIIGGSILFFIWLGWQKSEAFQMAFVGIATGGLGLFALLFEKKRREKRESE